MRWLQEVMDEGLKQGRIEQGDAQPAFLPGVERKLTIAAVAEAFQGGDGERFAAVHIVQVLGDEGGHLPQDVEEGGVGQVTLGGAQTAVLVGDEADDEGVEVGGCVHRMMASVFIRSRILKAICNSGQASQAALPR